MADHYCTIVYRPILLNVKHIIFGLLYSSVCVFADAELPEPYPIQFSIPEAKVVQEIPTKDKDFAFIVPGKLETYIYHKEEDYYKDYQRSYFAVTKLKNGWDCMRHYEILANGCIPYFVDLDKCPKKTLSFLPKELILEAMNLEGVSYMNIDHSVFNKEKYFEILNKLLEHTRNHLTSRNMATYLLECAKYSGNGKVLYLSQEQGADYLRCTMLIGLKEVLGDKVVDFPKIKHIYKSYEPEEIYKLYGNGFSYARAVEDVPIDRNSLEERIRNKSFELIIYGSVHRGLPFHELVQQFYSADQIFYMCGEDLHNCEYYNFQNLFLREFPSQPKTDSSSSFSIDRFHVCTVAPNRHPHLDMLIESCHKNGIDLEILGIDKPLLGNGMKLLNVQDYLNKLEEDEIVLFVNASDVLITDKKEIILSKFLQMKTPFIIETSRDCSCYGLLFSHLCYPQSPTPFRYINPGCYMGYVKHLKNWLKDMEPIDPHQDDRMQMITHYLRDDLARSFYAFDFYCNLFLPLYLIYSNELSIDLQSNCVHSLTTNTIPSIIHVNNWEWNSQFWCNVYDQLIRQ